MNFHKVNTPKYPALRSRNKSLSECQKPPQSPSRDRPHLQNQRLLIVTTTLTSNKEAGFAYLGTLYQCTYIVHTLLCLPSLVQYYFCKIYPCCWSSCFLTAVQYSIKGIYHDDIFFQFITDDTCLVSIWGLCATK